MLRNKSSRTTSSKSRKNSQESSIRTLYTNFESPRYSESTNSKLKYSVVSPLLSIKKDNMLQERLTKLCSKQTGSNLQQSRTLKKMPKRDFKGGYMPSFQVSVATQTDPVTLLEICPTLEHKLRLLELENQQIKRLLKIKMRIKSL